VIFGGRVAGWPGYNMVQKYPRKVKPLSRVHARHGRQTDDRRICHAISQTYITKSRLAKTVTRMLRINALLSNNDVIRTPETGTDVAYTVR